MRKPPYPTELKPYGRALVDLARRRAEILCLSGDLTRQCEVDLFQEQIPDRFVHGGMAEANMMSLAGALARCGHIPFVHTFGVFATRRPYDQIANAIARGLDTRRTQSPSYRRRGADARTAQHDGDRRRRRR
jgi:transketolase